jgi:hypothetical protein
MGGSEDDIDAFEDDSGIRRRSAIDTYEVEEGMTMRIKVNRIVPLVAVGAAAVRSQPHRRRRPPQSGPGQP